MYLQRGRDKSTHTITYTATLLRKGAACTASLGKPKQNRLAFVKVWIGRSLHLLQIVALQNPCTAKLCTTKAKLLFRLHSEALPHKSEAFVRVARFPRRGSSPVQKRSFCKHSFALRTKAMLLLGTEPLQNRLA